MKSRDTGSLKRRLTVMPLAGSALLLVTLAAPARGQTQTELNIRAGAAARAAETGLSAAYHRLPRTAELVAAERAWIAYRNKECRFEHHAAPDGSMYGMETARCEARMARERTEVLMDDLKEGY